MIHDDGTMDVTVDGKPARRRYSIKQDVTRGCITRLTCRPDLRPGESMTIATGKIPVITTGEKES